MERSRRRFDCHDWRFQSDHVDGDDGNESEAEVTSTMSSDSDDEKNDITEKMTSRLCATKSVHMPVRIQRIQREALRQEFPTLSREAVKICQRKWRKIIRQIRGGKKKIISP